MASRFYFISYSGAFAASRASGPAFNGRHYYNKDMGRFLSLFLILVAVVFAQSFKLYLKDGTFHVVREYQVKGDRVRFYSVERSEWEEIPVALLDLKRTESENSARKAKMEQEAKIISEEDKARRELQNEIMKIPQDPGAYMLENNQLRIFRAAESKVHTNKGRSVLKVLSPVPLIAGKATVEVDNPHSLNIIKDPRPEIYLQLSADERYGIIKLKPKGEVRIADRLSIVPVTKEVIDEIDEVPIFRKQLTENWLYKIWPEEPMENGEYAVVQFTPGKVDMQIWDFAIKAEK